MADNDQNVQNAVLRPRRWFSWVWIAPLGAAAIVIGLAIRGLEDRGPLVTISFTEAEGLQPGETKIKHKDVELGTVEKVYLTRDMARVMVEARMRRSVRAAKRRRRSSPLKRGGEAPNQDQGFATLSAPRGSGKPWREILRGADHARGNRLAPILGSEGKAPLSAGSPSATGFPRHWRSPRRGNRSA